MQTEKILRISIVYAVVLILVLPLLVILVWAFSQGWAWPSLLPGKFSLEGWSYFFNPRNGALDALALSFFIGIGVTILALLISIPAGKALGLYQFKGKRLINLLVLSPIIVPPLAAAMGMHINFIRYGLADTVAGVIMVHLIPTIPYSIRILTNIFSAIGDKFEEQARVLGARSWQRFFYITLPMICPGILSAAVLVFIISFSQYFLTFLIGGGSVITFPMVFFPLVKSGDRMLASVYSIAFIMGGLIFTFLIERLFRSEKLMKDHFYL